MALLTTKQTHKFQPAPNPNRLRHHSETHLIQKWSDSNEFQIKLNSRYETVP